MTTSSLNWASSKTLGRVSEIAVFAPVKRGRIPGERRTYEERVTGVMNALAGRIEHGLPHVLNLVPAIHFSRVLLIRPEQYLLFSQIGGQPYTPEQMPERLRTAIDAYRETGSEPRAGADSFASFLLVVVEFDGDLKVYLRDVAVFIRRAFDQVFENCEGFPGTENFEAFWEWIRAFQIRTPLFYSAYPQLSVVRIKQLELFKRRFDEFATKVRSPAGRKVQSMEELFDEFLRDNQQIATGFPNPGGTFDANGKEGGGR
ncbi:MAG TPA: hypothetical protein VFE13_04025 [Caulobacteraceae bacterium]|jgi:hypothetical protein|nr:hypothetical protein [Caulobacteraceae bacterium]